MKLWMIQYPHGFNDGFEYHDGKAPPLTTSSWQFNNFLVIEDDTNQRSDEEGLRANPHG